jgi:hypothetical protein
MPVPDSSLVQFGLFSFAGRRASLPFFGGLVMSIRKRL